MDEFEREIEEKIFNLSNEFVVLIRKNGLLNQFLRNYITNLICSKVSPQLSAGHTIEIPPSSLV